MRISEQETRVEVLQKSAIVAETSFFDFSNHFLSLLFFILIVRMFVLAMSG